MNLKETYVLIDGGYLSKITKRLGKDGIRLDIDLNLFAITLAKTQSLWVSGVYYY